MRTFKEAKEAGKASDSDIDTWVEDWHATGGCPEGEPISLRDYLGLSPKEYELWSIYGFKSKIE